jgi:hypothetical protein
VFVRQTRNLHPRGTFFKKLLKPLWKYHNPVRTFAAAFRNRGSKLDFVNWKAFHFKDTISQGNESENSH